MQPTEFKSPTRIFYGIGALARLGELVRQIEGRRVLLVSDPGLVALGMPEQAAEFMRKSELEVFLFDDFEEDPTSRMAEHGTEFARENKVDCLVGMGGGSSMDCAKAINFVLTNGGCMDHYRGYGKADKPMLPMIAIPTTAGTGSEVQSYALITDDETRVKMACGDPKAAFRTAILDPKLTVSLPPKVTAATGFDAIGHAVETYVTTRRNELSQFFSLEAWKLLANNFQRVAEEPQNLEARGAMLLGSCWAGIAIENSMLGATHALANPLSERYDTTHGIATAILLHHVIRWNAPEVGKLYEELVSAIGKPIGDGLADLLQAFLERSGLPTRLSQIGIDRKDFPSLAKKSLEQWTDTFNPRPLTESDALSLYEAAY